MRTGVAGDILSGHFPSQAYFKNLLIPSTMNTATASGLGRSGAMIEAVSNAVLGKSTDLLQAMLTGIPSPFGPVTSQTTSKTAGTADILGTVGGALQGIAPFIPSLLSGLGSLGSVLGTAFGNLFNSSPSIPDVGFFFPDLSGFAGG